MKPIRIQGVEESLVKKSKKKKKTKKPDVPIEKEGSRSPIPKSMIESQSEHEKIETLDDISEFVRNERYGEEDFNLQAEKFDDNEGAMLGDEIEETLSVGEKKTLKRQAALEVKVDRLERNLNTFTNDLKEIKNLLNIRSKTSKNKGGIVAYCKEACVFSLLPKFRLKMVSQVKKMETDVKNDDYKQQLVQNMSLIGGRTVKEFVINIFKKMFTAKLKAKFTWTGFSKKEPKEAFQHFEGIISAIQIAVSAHYDCTIADIENECKLRLKQAQKDYDRQKLRKKREKERLENERLTKMTEQEED